MLQANIVRRDPREQLTTRMERVKSSELRPSSKSVRSFVERSTITKALLKILGVVGVSLVMSGTLLEMICHFSVLAYPSCRRHFDTGPIRSRRDTRVG